MTLADPGAGAQGEGVAMGGQARAYPGVMVAVGVAVHRQRLLAALLQGVVAAAEFFIQALVVQPRQQRVTGPVRAEADQPGAFQFAHLLPVQGLGQGFGRAGVCQLVQGGRAQGLEALQVAGQRLAAGVGPLVHEVGSRQRPADLAQRLDQGVARAFAMAAPQGFAQALPPEALAAADVVGGQEDAGRYLVLLQQRERIERVVAPAVVEGQGNLGAAVAPGLLMVLEQVHQVHAIEVLA